ncbi:MAG: thiamine diphosphokinase [Clostridia bacterium]|nr:thiamine diphosphokinase [Clostridia bacterium]
MSKTCYIIGAGDVTKTDFTAEADDYIICADGGYRYKDLLGRECDCVVGDFDSFGSVPETENKIVAPCEKDETDMMLAVDTGYAKGYRDFILFGALGGERWDHSVANIQLLHYIASKGGTGTIIHGDEIFTAFKDDTLILDEKLKGYISVFSLSDESRGVTLKNLKYTLENAVLNAFNPVGVSNEFIGEKAEISVKDGVLLVVYKKVK